MCIWREVRNFASHWWFSLQRCCKMFCFCQTALCRMYVCTLWTSCLRAKIHYYYMWPFAKKLYFGWIITMTSSNGISWKLPPPEMRAGCAPGRDYTLDGTNIFTLMKHKLLRNTHEWRHHAYYNVVLRWLPNTSIYKMHEGVGGCEGPRVI